MGSEIKGRRRNQPGEMKERDGNRKKGRKMGLQEIRMQGQ